MQMVQRNIPRKISRQAAENNRIADEAAETGLLPGGQVAVEERACCSTAALGERGLKMQHGKEAETDRSNSQTSGLHKCSNAVPLHHQKTGRVKLAWMENNHIDSSEANSSSGEESPELCGDLNTQKQGTVELHPIQRQ